MKKKMLAMLLAAAMVVQPLSVAGAAEFTDGSMETAEEFTSEFGDGMDEVPEVEEVDVPVAAVAPSETAVQMGDDVWLEYNATTYAATISGTALCGII